MPEPTANHNLVADALENDKRVTEAKRLLIDALKEHKQTITEVRPAQADRAVEYAELIQQFGQMRGGQLFYPYLSSGIGNGSLVELADGSVKYDMINGIGVHYFGHSDERIVEACIDAAMSDTVMQGNLQQDVASMNLVDTLLINANVSGAQLAHCFLSTSGATANENALKIMFQKRHPASRVLAFEGAFAGRTLALAQVTDRPQYRDGLPATLNVDYLPRFDADNAEQSTADAVAVLSEHIARHPGKHACIVIELIAGEAGYYPGDRNFYLALFSVLREHDITIFFDEIQTFARTSRLFAFQHFGLDEFADVVTIGKNSQVCATLFRETFKPRPGLVSQTFTGSTSAIAAAQTIIDALLTGGYFGDDGRIMQIHQRFVGHFDAIGMKHPGWISGPYGLGGMVAMTPFDGSAAKAKQLIHMLFDNGVIAFVAGSAPVRVRFLPACGVITDDEIDATCNIVEATMAQLADNNTD